MIRIERTEFVEYTFVCHVDADSVEEASWQVEELGWELFPTYPDHPDEVKQTDIWDTYYVEA